MEKNIESGEKYESQEKFQNQRKNTIPFWKKK